MTNATEKRRRSRNPVRPLMLVLAGTSLVLHVHVGVQRYERPILELAERVDFGQRHVVLEEQAGQAGHVLDVSSGAGA